MKKKKIKIDSTQLDEEYINLTNLKLIFQNQDERNYLKYIFYFLFLIFFFNVKIVDKYDLSNLKIYRKYVNDCIKLKKNEYFTIKVNNPYLSICLSALNMENYIETNLLSIINQSFKNFEIIIINDFSTDNTENIIKRIQREDERIKLINHPKNLGVYRSRIESILNSKGKYIILMDPDDMFLNQNLFKELYKYNLKSNFDIIEFSVYQKIEGTRKIFFPDNHFENHFHNFPKRIIYQPELSNLLYYFPGTYEYSHTICRNIWNKMINRNLFLYMNQYIGIDYFNEFIITSDDMLMNIIIYQFAQNYTNIKLPGYLYNIRKVSMSRGEGGNKLKIIRTINHFYYFKIFYKYLKEYKKDRNYLFYEMKNLKHYILYIKDLNIKKFIPIEKKFIKEIIRDKYTSFAFKKFLRELLVYFIKKPKNIL